MARDQGRELWEKREASEGLRLSPDPGDTRYAISDTPELRWPFEGGDASGEQRMANSDEQPALLAACHLATVRLAERHGRPIPCLP